jgi:hypothetical protein
MNTYGFQEPTPEQIAAEARRKGWCARLKAVLVDAGLRDHPARQAAGMLSHGRFTGEALAEIGGLLAKIPREGDW